MAKLVIKGGQPLSGEVSVAGAKNAALPILMATLLADEPVNLSNIPALDDVDTAIALLQHLGSNIITRDHDIMINNAGHIAVFDAPYALVSAMRASVLVLGPMLARYGQAKVALPGGCAIGSRPVDLHIQALQQLGASISIENGYIVATCHDRLQGAAITFDTVTVTGTENVIMAATLAQGTTTIYNAALEPEVVDLCHFLVTLGARIEGIGQATITIHGVPQLHGGAYQVMPDRIEAATYLAAAVITRGCITLNQVDPSVLSAILDKFRHMGAELICTEHSIRIDMRGKRPKAVNILTAPYPGFPTDMQAQFVALNAIAEGTAAVTETIFENRFMHVPELKRMGAAIKLNQNTAICTGIEQLSPASVRATDLRASASLILAALATPGETTISDVYHADRGYEHLEQKLSELGAHIFRIDDTVDYA